MEEITRDGVFGGQLVRGNVQVESDVDGFDQETFREDLDSVGTFQLADEGRVRLDHVVIAGAKRAKRFSSSEATTASYAASSMYVGTTLRRS
jgi:hypothetical protein